MFAARWQQSRLVSAHFVFKPEAHRTGLVGCVRLTRTMCTLPLRVGMTPLLCGPPVYRIHPNEPLVQRPASCAPVAGWVVPCDALTAVRGSLDGAPYWHGGWRYWLPHDARVGWFAAPRSFSVVGSKSHEEETTTPREAGCLPCRGGRESPHAAGGGNPPMPRAAGCRPGGRGRDGAKMTLCGGRPPRQVEDNPALPRPSP